MSKPLTLISATPSAYARMNRIAFSLKGIPFKVQNEIPWESKTITPQYNPLEKLPILLFPDNRPPVYESAHIQNYIVEKYASVGPLLLPGDLDGNLLAKQIVALSVGCMDALVLSGWEMRRKKEQQSQKWIERQIRKVDGSMRAFNDYVEAANGRPYVLGKEISIADIGIACAVGGIDFVGLRPGWQRQYPALSEYCGRLDRLKEFQDTKPIMFNITEQVV
ncbi:glutathione S-transferase [Macroventuria anomochaeta]|uniref:Glutathione S-transferase n=1 Tax=Macroventuria anomochaeta TaxID=301207 RepID=A0ACB6RJ36_9PLEO|nr:glutathione S-transferase [Macroventuria anomochaeta]KAF2621113.1 glutathione S-transferase [Macroventuria anomochaeta]